MTSSTLSKAKKRARRRINILNHGLCIIHSNNNIKRNKIDDSISKIICDSKIRDFMNIHQLNDNYNKINNTLDNTCESIKDTIMNLPNNEISKHDTINCKNIYWIDDTKPI
ncbi:hypothetical protein HELRODRAFT_175803 [Helobdella robusta]|uniref:Uncharacterized protein n=1 Tax=Helobdella robusta TaxID=6412 RepID=T1F9N9_HELRO|nr:hypothetical protein HELRODRAFT_175803 [Helobdella robusta]ESO00386.1 hypothetical protein HELRODRAFT_175803 [Helobdella robusta]